jgi:hypothetical protein
MRGRRHHEALDARMSMTKTLKQFNWLFAPMWLSATLLLASCNTTSVSFRSSLEAVDQSVREGKYLYAYVSYRTIWLASSADGEIGRSAVDRAKANKRVIEAGYRDLAKESVAKAMSPDFPRFLAFHRELAAVDLEQLKADGIKLQFEDRDEAQKAEDEVREAKRAAARTMVAKRDAARTLAVWQCNGSAACEKAFALAQIFVNDHSDMKIQVATNTIVETYNPTDPGKVGMKVVKLPLSGDTAELRLTNTCKGGAEAMSLCLTRETQGYEQFRAFMSSHFQR